MAVSGHKSVWSLAVYQRVSSTEKLAMASTLASHMTPQIKSTSVTNEIAGLELDDWQIDLESLQLAPAKRENFKLPIFNNCTIGTINIMSKEM